MLDTGIFRIDRHELAPDFMGFLDATEMAERRDEEAWERSVFLPFAARGLVRLCDVAVLPRTASISPGKPKPGIECACTSWLTAGLP